MNVLTAILMCVFFLFMLAALAGFVRCGYDAMKGKLPAETAQKFKDICRIF